MITSPIHSPTYQVQGNHITGESDELALQLRCINFNVFIQMLFTHIEHTCVRVDFNRIGHVIKCANVTVKCE